MRDIEKWNDVPAELKKVENAAHLRARNRNVWRATRRNRNDADATVPEKLSFTWP